MAIYSLEKSQTQKIEILYLHFKISTLFNTYKKCEFFLNPTLQNDRVVLLIFCFFRSSCIFIDQQKNHLFLSQYFSTQDVLYKWYSIKNNYFHYIMIL